MYPLYPHGEWMVYTIEVGVRGKQTTYKGLNISYSKVHSRHWIVQQLTGPCGRYHRMAFVCVCLIDPRATPNLTTTRLILATFRLLLYSHRLPIDGAEVGVPLCKILQLKHMVATEWRISMQIPFCIPFKIESTLAVLCNTANASLPRQQRCMEPFLMPHRETRIADDPRLWRHFINQHRSGLWLQADVAVCTWNSCTAAKILWTVGWIMLFAETSWWSKKRFTRIFSITQDTSDVEVMH